MNAKAPDNQIVSYPFEAIPEHGQPTQLAEGVYWLRMPLPLKLDHINLWLLEGEEGFTIVDTGWRSKENIAIWQQIAENFFQNKPVERVVVTHLHPDHAGLAGWLTETHQVELYMSRAEYLSCHLLVNHSKDNIPPEAISFYHAAGYTAQQLQNYRDNFGFFSKLVHKLPQAFRRLSAGDTLKTGHNDWQVVIGEGHSPEHICLHNSQDKLFISGDQLLPTISSNVGVWPTEPQANPLADWLDSCHRLSELVSDDTLILPAHGKPFYGGKARLTFQIQEIHDNLAKLLEFCKKPRRAVDTFDVLFKSKISDGNLMLATAESLSHLHYLREQGLVTASYRDGVTYWQAK